jgi:uncharacterized protein YegL
MSEADIHPTISEGITMARPKLFDEDLAENPTKRVAVALCIDTSGSMAGDKARQLEDAIKTFYGDVDADPAAHAGAEICIVAYNDDANVVQDFKGIESVERDIRLYPDGCTNTGAGVLRALEELKNRKEMYTRHGVRYVQPWLVLMSDGATYPDQHEALRDQAIQRVNELVDAGKLTVIPVAIGTDANLNELARFSPEIPPLSRQPLNFAEFFKWLSQSLARASQDAPGERPEIDEKFIGEHVDVEAVRRDVDPKIIQKYKQKYGELF